MENNTDTVVIICETYCLTSNLKDFLSIRFLKNNYFKELYKFFLLSLVFRVVLYYIFMLSKEVPSFKITLILRSVSRVSNMSIWMPIYPINIHKWLEHSKMCFRYPTDSFSFICLAPSLLTIRKIERVRELLKL